MAYRDDSEALKERYASLASALEGVRAQASALAYEEDTLAKELDAIRERLDGERHGARRRRTHAFAATMFSAGACALLSLTAIARVMTSEIAPLEMRDATAVYVPVEVTTVEAPDLAD